MRACPVDTTGPPHCAGVFPMLASMICLPRPPPLLLRVPLGGVPRYQRSYEATTTPHPCLGHFGFPRAPIPTSRRCRSLMQSAAADCMPGPCSPGRPIPGHFVGRNEVSPVPWESTRAFAALSDPGRSVSPDGIRVLVVAPAKRMTKAPTVVKISRFNDAASAPAVYASGHRRR